MYCICFAGFGHFMSEAFSSDVEWILISLFLFFDLYFVLIFEFVCSYMLIEVWHCVCVVLLPSNQNIFALSDIFLYSLFYLYLYLYLY